MDQFFVDFVAFLDDDDEIDGGGCKDWLDEAVVHSCVETIYDVLTMIVGFCVVGIVIVFFVIRTDLIDGNNNSLGNEGVSLMDQRG